MEHQAGDGPPPPTRATSGPALGRHLATWLGCWPPAHGQLEVVEHVMRDQPGWDGHPQPFVGVTCPQGGVLSVRPGMGERVRPLVTGPDDTRDPRWRAEVARALQLRDQVIGRDVYRVASATPGTDLLPDIGRWVGADDPALPAWLRPFNAPEALVAYDDEGQELGAVGIKLLTEHGAEIAAVVAPRARGRGTARRLAAQASRRLLADGRLPTVVHAADNLGSATAADAVGFHDEGWWVLEVLPREPRWRHAARAVRRRAMARR